MAYEFFERDRYLRVVLAFSGATVTTRASLKANVARLDQ